MSRKRGRDIAASESQLPQLQQEEEEEDADAFTLLGRTVTDLPLPVLRTVLPPRPRPPLCRSPPVAPAHQLSSMCTSLPCFCQQPLCRRTSRLRSHLPS